jgi:SAM-dependent methyltransferase
MDILYSNELHEHYVDRTTASAARIAPLALQWVKPSSVVDIGCGHGYWLKPFVEQGIHDVLGVDGDYVDKDKLAIPQSQFRPMDLNQPTPLGRTFDLAISLEVAEHLRPDAGPRFVEFLTSCSSCILFSAAIPGQPGNDHRNARWPSYWKKLFEAQGYVALDPVRREIWHDDQVMMCYRQNVLLMVRRDRYEADATLQALPKANCLMLIDEEALAYYVSAKESVKRLLKPGQA